MNTNLYQVKVVNNNDFDISDRWDGHLYNLKANSETNIPYPAAVHIFGVEFVGDARGSRNDLMFNHLQRRWGWNNLKAEQSKKIFDNLDFKVVAMSLVESIVEDKEPEMAEPRAKKKFTGIKRKPQEASEEVA